MSPSMNRVTEVEADPSPADNDEDWSDADMVKGRGREVSRSWRGTILAKSWLMGDKKKVSLFGELLGDRGCHEAMADFWAANCGMIAHRILNRIIGTSV